MGNAMAVRHTDKRHYTLRQREANGLHECIACTEMFPPDQLDGDVCEACGQTTRGQNLHRKWRRCLKCGVAMWTSRSRRICGRCTQVNQALPQWMGGVARRLPNGMQPVTGE